MTDDKLKSIEQYARTLPNPIFALDVEQLVAEVRRLRALLMPSRPDLSGLSREELAARGVYVRDIQPATNEELGIIVAAAQKDDDVK